MQRYTFYQRFRYFFDNTMSRGTIALVFWLGIVSTLVVFVAGLFLFLFQVPPNPDKPEEAFSIGEGTWQSIMRTLDAGTGAGDEGTMYRIISFTVTLAGIFIISTLIGVISGGLESTIEELRKGKSLVIEQNHTIILGWSSKVFTLISELSLANESNRGGVVVVLADRDKVEMEDEIRMHLPDLKGTRVICRSGSTHDIGDLQIVNPTHSKSIIILASEEGNSDSQTIKTILALSNIRKKTNTSYHMVAEIKSFRNMEVAKMVGGNEVEMVFPDDITARIMVQASRQTGLSLVYSNLMDFGDAEIYFAEEKNFAGKTYADLLVAYETCCVMGVQKSNGEVELNPNPAYVFQANDKIVAIAEDDTTFKPSTKTAIPVGTAVHTKPSARPAERSLLLGWNHRAPIMIKEMDKYASPSSYLLVVSTYDTPRAEVEELAQQLSNVKLEFMHADTTDRAVIESLEVPKFDYVLLLCYQNELELQDADAETLITLLHLRRICDAAGKATNIVSEMLDLRNCELAEVTKADDFIVSDKLISLLITQVSENKHLMQVFNTLFSAEGSEIYLKPAKHYLQPNTPANFYTLIQSALQKNETVIGYRQMQHSQDVEKSYGIVLNPTKSNTFTLTENDFVIVLAES